MKTGKMQLKGHAKVASASERAARGKMGGNPAVHDAMSAKDHPPKVASSIEKGKAFTERHKPDAKPAPMANTIHEKGAKDEKSKRGYGAAKGHTTHVVHHHYHHKSGESKI